MAQSHSGFMQDHWQAVTKGQALASNPCFQPYKSIQVALLKLAVQMRIGNRRM